MFGTSWTPDRGLKRGTGLGRGMSQGRFPGGSELRVADPKEKHSLPS